MTTFLRRFVKPPLIQEKYLWTNVIIMESLYGSVQSAARHFSVKYCFVWGSISRLGKSRSFTNGDPCSLYTVSGQQKRFYGAKFQSSLEVSINHQKKT